MYVDLTRSSVDLLRLRKQSLASNSDTLSVTLTLEDGSTYQEKGRLALTEVAVDESTGSVTLRAIFPNPQHVLLPGMFVRARIDEGIMNDAILRPAARGSPAMPKATPRRWWSMPPTKLNSVPWKPATPTAINGWC